MVTPSHRKKERKGSRGKKIERAYGRVETNTRNARC